ncbi:MAG: hypothetical protein LH473_08020 [Chitinophagales bacterium]|nr:hypothetical protein [Chitinophagales bacterium]
MKQKLLALFSICICITAKAQQAQKIKIEVQEVTEKMSQGYNTCLKVFIPGADKKEVERAMLKYMKNFDSKGDSKKDEYFYDNAMIKQFGISTVDVYSVATQQKEGVMLEVYFDLGGRYLNSKNDSANYVIAERMIHDFAKEQTKQAFQNQLADVQRILNSKLGEQSDMEKENDALQKKIRECQSTIKSAEENIVTNENNQVNKKKEIEEHQKLMETLKATEAGVE